LLASRAIEEDRYNHDEAEKDFGHTLARIKELHNAAVALYGKSEQLPILHPQLGIRLARFRGVNRLADFTDNR
jgi:hypothetical protein